MTRLTVRRGPNVGAVYELDHDSVTLGRGTKNDIAIEHDDISREHCRLVRRNGEYELYDLGSTNGTFINGQRVNSGRLLQSGVLIELADAVTLLYESGVIGAEVSSRMAEPQPAADPSPSYNGPYFLVLNLGREAERVFILNKETIRVGRDLSNDVVIQDPEISRWHLQLQRVDQGYQVMDLGSTNGTILNGERLEGAQTLALHDILELSTSARLRYVREIGDAAANAAAPTAPSREQVATSSIRETGEIAVESPDRLKTRELRSDVLNLSGRRKTSQLGTGMVKGSLLNHVFISYARDDWEAIIAPMTVILQDAGMSVWVDQYLTPGGDDWQEAVEQALGECWLLVVVISPEALESRSVKLAYRYFINREKPVIPFVYQSSDKLPTELGNLELIRYDKENPKRSFQRLIFEILHKRS